MEKIPPEKRWEITAKILSIFSVIRGEKIIAPLLGEGEGIISPIWGAEKWDEINEKIFVDAAKQFIPRVKEMFNIPVEDAMGAANLFYFMLVLACGPEIKGTIVETTPERVVFRWTQCPWWNLYKEFEVDPAFMPCPKIHQAESKAVLKAINPKLTFKMTKAMPWGDPYCEDVYEFKDK